MIAVHSPRRLPGFRFEVQAPPLIDVLSRMDVAIFVGFSASGPIGVPVAVESSTQFEAIFGADAPLAWDTKRGTQIYAYLAPAVRAFFRNGGVRCWVYRVAWRETEAPGIAGKAKHNRARTNYFPISGLARAEFDHDGNLASFTPAFARARAEGSWSDSLRVSTALQISPLQVGQVVRLDGPEPILDLEVASPSNITEGDLLQLNFELENYRLLFAVKKIEDAPESSPPLAIRVSGRRTLRVTGTKAIWCTSFSIHSSPPDMQVKVSNYTFEPEDRTAGNLASEQKQTPNFQTVTDAVLVASATEQTSSPPSFDTARDKRIEQELTLDLGDISFADAPQPGAVLRVEFVEQSGLMKVTRVSMRRDGAQQERVRVTGEALALLQNHPTPLPSSVPAVERISFDLWVRDGDESAISISDLAFDSSHSRFWGLLPTDEKLYRETEAGERPVPAIVWWRPAGDVMRFPLAGTVPANEIFFPLAMPALPDEYQGPVHLPGTALERDGLARFDASLFLDDALLEASVESLLSQAEFLRFLAAQPRQLRGIHAAVGCEEPTIIAAPDAVHRGWQLAPEETPPRTDFPRSIPRKEWWTFLDCEKKAEIKAVAEPEWGHFLSCGIKIIPAPRLNDPSDPVNQTGTFSLSWTFDSSVLSANEPVKFVLEESTEADFSGAIEVYVGPVCGYTTYGRRPADYFYRVRAVAGSNTSDWSNGVTVRITSINRWLLKSEADYDSSHLLAVQRALLRISAARGDLLAVMSLPQHYREAQALEHLMTLKLTPERTPPTEGVSALGYGEAAAYSYGAIYHPWLVGREESRFDELRQTPPCGAMCGILARRANARGAWIAPANEVVRDVVSLIPSILSEHRLSLLEAQINLIQQEPRGFLSLSADTLSDDKDLRPINVRRLLILLRRMALRLGATYVFEPHSDSFRRLVQRGFNAMLDQMFVRGAFGGSTPKTSYQVVTDESLNTPQSIEQGRFIVELRVAPSLPMTFLTVRLVQSGDRSLVTEGRI
jgi:hypothetical protein